MYGCVIFVVVITDPVVGKVMFSQTCISHSVHGGVSQNSSRWGISQHADGRESWGIGGCGIGGVV